MTRRMALAACLAGALIGWVAGAAPEGKPQWGSDLEAGRRAASSAGKPLLVDFAASWCGPCRMMEEEVFPDARVKPLLDRFVLVRLDVDTARAEARRFGVNAIPRLLVLRSGGGRPALDLQGARDAEQFANELRSALGMPPLSSGAGSRETPAIARVRDALQAGTYASVKAADPRVAAEGLAGLIDRLGAVTEADHAAGLALIKKAGEDAPPALIRGLTHRVLAVRAGCYRALQELFPPQGADRPPAYDPWAPAPARSTQAQRWASWWRAEHPARR